MINPNFEKLENNYLFADIARRVHDFKSENPESVLISMGIGDVTLPLAPAVVKALESASREQGEQGSFHGYGPYEGYDFLRETISARYAGRGISLSADEIFVGDGAKNDLGSVLSIFSSGAHVVIPDPVYPAYLDSNVLAGNDITFVSGCAANKYLPDPPDYAADLAYICSPNNPTGAVYDREGLGRWVHWANGCGAVLLFDAAYEGFVRNTFYPRSIFEIDGARRCAIEFCSLSKTAGFTGTRCGWTVFPFELKRDGISLRELWSRRLAVSYNGCSYVIQRGAAAALCGEGEAQSAHNVSCYLENARVIAAALSDAGISFVGGENSPYIWFECPQHLGSWETFELLLSRAHVVCTPGAGFGVSGEGRCRLSAFGRADSTSLGAARVHDTLLAL